MTKKHFIELAKFMLANKGRITPANYALACRDLADVCARNGANFNRVKFMEACK